MKPDPWCDWCQREFAPDGPEWKVETGVVTGFFCSKGCADCWSDATDTPERVGDPEIRADGGESSEPRRASSEVPSDGGHVRSSDADLAAHDHANDVEAALDYVMEAVRRARVGTVEDGPVARLQLAERGARLAFYATSEEERAVALTDATVHLETAVEAIEDQAVTHPARHALQLFAGRSEVDAR